MAVTGGKHIQVFFFETTFKLETVKLWSVSRYFWALKTSFCACWIFGLGSAIEIAYKNNLGACAWVCIQMLQLVFQIRGIQKKRKAVRNNPAETYI